MPKDNFPPHPEWISNKGTNNWCMQKMYFLLFQSGSLFDITNKINSVSSFKGTLTKGIMLLEDLMPLPTTGATIWDSFRHSIPTDLDSPSLRIFKFNHPVNGNLVLFFPDEGLSANYHRTKKDPKIGISETKFNVGFKLIAGQIAANPKVNGRFILPIYEYASVGHGHIVPLIIDYDAQTKSISATVYDSIGRGTFADACATFFERKIESTADNTLTRYLRSVIEDAPAIQRIGYSHQNRARNGHCGLFTFRTIYQAIIDFSARGIGPVAIPKSNEVFETDHHYLTRPQIRSIQQLVHHASYSSADLLKCFSKVAMPSKDLCLRVSSDRSCPKPTSAEDWPAMQSKPVTDISARVEGVMAGAGSPVGGAGKKTTRSYRDVVGKSVKGANSGAGKSTSRSLSGARKTEIAAKLEEAQLTQSVSVSF